ncbi:Nn.00g018970.m01.CDS01 [Neocucurbitaria sp. VM-36]
MVRHFRRPTVSIASASDDNHFTTFGLVGETKRGEVRDAAKPSRNAQAVQAVKDKAKSFVAIKKESGISRVARSSLSRG